MLVFAIGAQADPQCKPSTFNVSALQAGSVTVSPLAGSRDASPYTQISFLGVPASALHAITVRGSRTGSHPGRLLAYSQGDGASFVPGRPFSQGELVTVHARVTSAGSTHALAEQFAIAEQDPISETPVSPRARNTHEFQVFHSRPDLHPPDLIVTAARPGAAPGEIFATPFGGPGQSGPLIAEGDGSPVWFAPLHAGSAATDLQVQSFEGRPVLTWWQGDISIHGFGLGEDVIDDSTYSTIARVRAGNGYRSDLHEFRLTPRGTALITAYAPLRCDLSSIGNSTEAAVIDGVLQEIDVRTGLVRFEWTSLDHARLDESYEHAHTKTIEQPFDYFHINAINLDADESLLVSARNTWTVYELDPHTLQVLWRLGGKHPSFKMGSGTNTAWQHDSREIAEDEFSIFDNGSSPGVHSESRGVVVRIDPEHRTATRVAQVTHSPRLLASSQGNFQLLPNGDWFLGWGADPYFSELTPAGLVVLDAHFPAGTQSYRDFRFAWTGTPTHRPAFALAHGRGTLYASWNGSTLTAAWRVLEGSSARSLSTVAQVPRTGFETAIPIPAPARGSYITVQALDAAGNVLSTGPVERMR
jgi:Arylsulfotransferase (ASST)